MVRYGLGALVLYSSQISRGSECGTRIPALGKYLQLMSDQTTISGGLYISYMYF